VFDALDQGGQIRLLEADLRRRNSVTLDIWREVLVVRVYTGQLRKVRMFKRVIPGNFFAGLIDFVAVVANASGLKVNEFPNVQDDITCEGYLSLKFGQCRADGSQNQR
jgi:hypothetical protein